VMAQTEIDVAGALATAACHVWITDTAHEDQAKSYDTLAEVKANKKLANFDLVRLSRLSIMKVTDEQWKIIEEMAGR